MADAVEPSIWIILLPATIGAGVSCQLSEPDYHLAPHPCRATLLEQPAHIWASPWGQGASREGKYTGKLELDPCEQDTKAALWEGPLPLAFQGHKVAWLSF